MKKVYVFENFLSKDECSSILEKCKSELTLKRAQVRGSKFSDKRKSSIAFVDSIELVDDKLKSYLKDIIQLKGYTVTGLGPYQFTEYKVGEYYDWHTDSDGDEYKDRYVSIVIQLNDEYTSGYLQLQDESGEKVRQLDRGVGNLYIFYSNIKHRVLPISDGVRYSLVNWVSLKKIDSYKTTLI